MEYSVQELSKTKIEIAMNISKEEWAESVKEAYQKTKHQYALEGFRKGKVPMNILVKRYGVEIFYDEALDIELSKRYNEIIKNDELDVVGRPDVDIKEVSEDGVKAVITVVVKPTFELGQYKGLTVEKVECSVPDSEIDAVIEKELNDRARLVEKEGTVEKGDTVILDFSGSVDGVKFEGGTAENHTLEIGSGAFIPGFEEQIVGMAKDEARDINVTFPTEYNPELAGKAAVFAIVIKEVQKKEIPILDDEFVKDIDDELNTVAEWRERIAKGLKENKERDAEHQLENQIMEKIVAGTEIELPECMIDEELDYRVQELERSMTQYGLKFSDYLQYTGATVEKIKEEKREEAIRNIKFRLVMEAILKKEEITLTSEEINAEFDKLSDEQKKNSQSMSYVANQLIVDKLFAYLKENNNIVEGKGENNQTPAKKPATKKAAPKAKKAVTEGDAE